MLNFPLSPGIGGERLRAYLTADPNRRAVYDNILDRLTPDGRVGILTRCYVMRSSYRRMVFRGVLAAVGQPIPGWAKETPEAAASNRLHLARYRDAYNAVRFERRARAA
ncbi:MAG: hypothetical protein RIC51_05205 [Erythrobacter sp.]|uniref:hypothetical protein n=1 Tax=Erythrobacter sp. TaxID=1042 RepID=UPI0032EF6A06